MVKPEMKAPEAAPTVKWRWLRDVPPAEWSTVAPGPSTLVMEMGLRSWMGCLVIS